MPKLNCINFLTFTCHHSIIQTPSWHSTLSWALVSDSLLQLILFILGLSVILINNGKYSWSNINYFFFIYDHPSILVHRIIFPHNISANFTYNGDRLLILHLKLQECGLRLLVDYVAVIVYDLIVQLVILVIFLIFLLFWKRIILSLLFLKLLLFDFLSYF